MTYSVDRHFPLRDEYSARAVSTIDDPRTISSYADASRAVYQERLYSTCFSSDAPTANSNRHTSMLVYRRKAESLSPHAQAIHEQRQRDEQQKLLNQFRIQPIHPTITLDAVGIGEDGYRHLLDAPQTGKNRMAVGLNSHIYLLYPDTNTVEQLQWDGKNQAVSCISWQNYPQTELLSCFEDGTLMCIDTVRNIAMYRRPLRLGEIDCLETRDPACTYLGTKDGRIARIDLREKGDPTPIGAHQDRIRSLALNPHDSSLLASGGEDRGLSLWDVRYSGRSLATYHIHTAGVRALAWAPMKRELLFSGGGTEDRAIKALLTQQQRELAVDSWAQSAVTDLKAVSEKNELISSHGLPHPVSIVWEYRDERLIPKKLLQAHQKSLLYSTLLPDRRMFVTASSDETINCWELYKKPQTGGLTMPSIR